MSWVKLQLLAWYSSQLLLAQLEKLFDEHCALETSTAELQSWGEFGSIKKGGSSLHKR